MAHISPVNPSVQPLEPITTSKNCAATTLLISGVALGLLAFVIGGLALQAGVTGSSNAFLHSFTFLGKEEALFLMGVGMVASVALILLSAHFRKENEGEENIDSADSMTPVQIGEVAKNDSENSLQGNDSLPLDNFIQPFGNQKWEYDELIAKGMTTREIRDVCGYQFSQLAIPKASDFANIQNNGGEPIQGICCCPVGEAERLYPILPSSDERVAINKAKMMNAQLIGKQVGLMVEGLTKAEVEVVFGQQPITLSRNREYAVNFQRLKGQELFDFLHVVGDHQKMTRCLLKAVHQARREQAEWAFAKYYAQEIIWMKQLEKREDIDPEYQNAFLQDPIKTTREIEGEANSDALLYTLALAPSLYDNLGRLVLYTIEGCKVTHADPRCAASAVVLNIAIALFMRGYQDVDQVMYIAGEIAEEFLKVEAQKHLLSEDALSQSIEQLHVHMSGDCDTLALDENSAERPINFTYKCLGAACLSLRTASELQKKGKSHEEIFQTVIEAVARQGGDAESNCALSATLVTAFLGACGPGRIFCPDWKQALSARTTS